MTNKEEDSPVIPSEFEKVLKDLQNAPQLEMNKHRWRQEGYTLIDTCGSCMRQGINIEPGTMLVGEKGAYKIVRE